jgi:preprotein translocase subunit YajC
MERPDGPTRFMHTDASAFLTTSTPILAQAGDGPGLAGNAPAPANTTAAPGGTQVDPNARPAGGFDFVTLMIFGVLAALIVSTVLGGRREKKKYEAMMSGLKKNDQVRTVGGIIGSVVEVKPDVVVLKVDENSNTKITVARGKIEAVMKDA